MNLRSGVTLVYSPDDEEAVGKGYYWQRLSDWATSQLFASESKASTALSNGKVSWTA